MAYLIQSISNYHFDDVKDNSVLITILRLDKNIFRNSGYRYIISENHNWHPDENGDSNYLKNAVRKSLETKESILIQLETEEFKKNGFEYILSEEDY
ncbi:MAG: hypothetical protein HKO66_10435 [Saprospiraceae bacterium]|nr:hypothetical protein [Bacteroidia bacterium]NNL92640.1 hypothetical protein [Saprospiraceae bacterium]